MISVLTISNRPERIKLVEQALNLQNVPFEWIVEDYVDKSKPWSFNTATNMALKRAKGDLIVFIQDSIYFDPDALEKFQFHFENNPKACVSGIGDQYSNIGEDGKPINRVWIDPRRAWGDSFVECRPEDWEINFASCPRKLLLEIGGFDEEMDQHYGLDNVAVAYRLEKAGAEFYLDMTNESYSLKHERRPDWDKNNWSKHGFWDFFENRPTKLPYLI